LHTLYAVFMGLKLPFQQ